MCKKARSDAAFLCFDPHPDPPKKRKMKFSAKEGAITKERKKMKKEKEGGRVKNAPPVASCDQPTGAGAASRVAWTWVHIVFENTKDDAAWRSAGGK
jgi:hypothetical protein